MANKKINPDLRKKFILNTLNEQESITIEEIIKKCNVSEITIRRDLTELEEEGLLIKIRGGAIRSKIGNQLFSYDAKMNQNWQRKEKICQIASRYIENNDVIFIDCGTTLFHLTKYIKRFESLIVITTSLPIVSELLSFQNIKLILIGGEVTSERKAMYGPIANANISRYHADKAFIGADGISLQSGLSSYDEKEADITLQMVENADKTFLLCDSSKIEKNSFIKFAPFSKIDFLITNDDISLHILNEYRDSYINVIIE